MNGSELLLIVVVALIVFGPSKLPMLASHLGILARKMIQLKMKTSLLWQQQLKEFQLQENLRKAKEADESYKKSELQR